ncbi:SPOR domain-containing protein [Sulfurimonas autotrophica]|uniref:Sporulation domain protein n=1 Tax=Sulfurimonas autotrophica (strain ATCC BAA-671 / DSM 16294 / JCM 11897 / OK10) TaxID=563040 RepID=E0UU78_SULAO|nr:SPOR domain-containing protein [Sulfurimonas autotrophica]ADN09453.1 Sporulation domain protein [Sulfurimonas autotrophica DSM 16294]
MNDKNELSDIVLNKNGSSSSNKKIILAVATLGIILIIVVMLMNSLSSQGTDNLPQAVLPPEPQAQVATQKATEEPLFEDVEVIQDNASSDEDLDKIAQKLKQESAQEQKVVAAPKKVVTKKKKVAPKPQATSTVKYYIQVGSFSKYEPNKKFLKSITDLGYKYTYHKVKINAKTLNKVLIGPFKTQKEANNAKRVIRAKIEPGAFLVKL